MPWRYLSMSELTWEGSLWWRIDGRGPGIGGDDGQVEDRVVCWYAGKGDDGGEEYDYALVNVNMKV